MTTITLSGGDLGAEVMRVRCDLTEASATVEVDYQTGNGWQPTQYQCADARHRAIGLIFIGRRLAAAAVEKPDSEFHCEARLTDAPPAGGAECQPSTREGVRDARQSGVDPGPHHCG